MATGGRGGDGGKLSRQRSYHLHAALVEAESERDNQGEDNDDTRLGNPGEDPPRN